MTEPEREMVRAVAHLDAMRLAREATSDYEAFVKVVDDLLLTAPKGPGKGDTLSVQLLLNAIRGADLELKVRQ